LPDKDSAEARETLLHKMEAAAAAGVDWIQIREKNLSARELASLTREALQRVAKASRGGASPAHIIVNDRLDVALSERSGGVHFGENSLPAVEVKRLADVSDAHGDFLIGVSCHSLGAARIAESSGADYIFFGPVFATPSKAGYGAAQGLERLAEVCHAVSLPVLAIGGVNAGNAGPCLFAGASGIAAIRFFQDAQDVTSAVQAMKERAV
jgi:thiamine-phosphate pyrophosphorylase